MEELLANPLVRGAITGWVVASAADIVAFRSWKSYDEAMKYDYKIMAWRWGQGIVGGVLTALGLGAL